MKTKRNSFVRIVSFLTLFIFMMTNTVLAETLRAARVLDFSGTVRIMKAGGEKEFPAFKGMSLDEGDRIMTDADSWISLGIDEDKEVKIGENSQFGVSELEGSTEAQDERTGLSLWAGKLWTKIKNKLNVKSKFEVKTPTTIMGVRGTQFYVGQRNGRTDVAVLEGTVAATSYVPVQNPDGTAAMNEQEIMLQQNQQVSLDETIQSPADVRVEDVTTETLDLFVLEQIRSDPEGVDSRLLDGIDNAIEQRRAEEQLQQQMDQQREQNQPGQNQEGQPNTQIQYEQAPAASQSGSDGANGGGGSEDDGGTPPPDITPPDTQAPQVSAASVNVTENNAVLTVEATENAVVYWAVLDASAPAPDREAVKSGSESFSASDYFSYLTSQSPAATNLPVLAPGTYKAYVAAEDAAGNISDVAATGSFVISQPVDPSISPLDDIWMVEGAGKNIDITAAPANAAISASSSDTSVAGVVVAGNTAAVTAGVKGTAVITVTASNGYTSCTEQFRVTVKGLVSPKTIAASQTFSISARTNGEVWSWGSNGFGQLGTGTNTGNELVPVKTSGLPDINIKAVAAGYGHTVVLDNRGRVYAWGSNGSGQVGNGNKNDIYTPQLIMDNVIQIAAGTGHTVALRADGTVWTWGSGSAGQLGRSVMAEAPGMVPGMVTDADRAGLSGVKAIAAGSNQSFAVMEDGTVRAWGSNNYGKLGNGTEGVNALYPLEVRDSTGSGALAGVKAIATGERHTLALMEDGRVMAWGANYSGQLGDNTYRNSTLPKYVEGVKDNTPYALTDIIDVSAGDEHSSAVKSDGTVWGWGSNWSGRLGVSGMPESTAPVPAGYLTNAAAVSAGYDHTLAVKSDGTVWGWGDNDNGQLGNGTTSQSYDPVQCGLIQSSITPGTVYYNLGGSNEARPSVTMSLYGNTLNSITENSSTLIENTDYTIENNVVTFTETYLNGLGAGSYQVYLNFSDNVSRLLDLEITDSAPSGKWILSEVYSGSLTSGFTLTVKNIEGSSCYQVWSLGSADGVQAIPVNIGPVTQLTGTPLSGSVIHLDAALSKIEDLEIRFYSGSSGVYQLYRATLRRDYEGARYGEVLFDKTYQPSL